LPHFLISGGRSIYHALGNDFSLLAFGDQDIATIEQAALARAMPLSVLRLNAGDAPNLHSLVLVRPDLYIAWSSAELPTDPGEILDQARGEYSW
jgi:hypothetical protein